MAPFCSPSVGPLRKEVKVLQRTIRFMQKEKPLGYKRFIASYQATIRRLERAIKVNKACAADRAQAPRRYGRMMKMKLA